MCLHIARVYVFPHLPKTLHPNFLSTYLSPPSPPERPCLSPSPDHRETLRADHQLRSRFIAVGSAVRRRCGGARRGAASAAGGGGPRRPPRGIYGRRSGLRRSAAGRRVPQFTQRDICVCVCSLSPFLLILTNNCRDGRLGGNPKLGMLHYTNLTRLLLCVNTRPRKRTHTLHKKVK